MDSRLTPSPANQDAQLGLDVNGIMWTDRTINPGLAGCAKVSPACTNCYAEITAAGIVRKGRSEKSSPGMRATADFYAEGLTADGRWTGRVAVHPERIGPAFASLPKKAGQVRRVFFSMIDLFHKDVPDEFICKTLAEMRARPWLTFQVLTKRAERLAAFAAGYGWGWPANVWAGVTVEDQRRADERIPHLLQVPAAVRFLSVEPMLGSVDLRRVRQVVDDFGRDDTCTIDALTGAFSWKDPTESGVGRALSWVIVGSESDGPRPGARETDPAWALDLVDQCDAASVPVFVKQLAIDGRLCSLPMVDGRVRAGFPNV